MDANGIMETVKSSFIYNFRTGNVAIDTVVTGLIIMFSSYLLSLINNIVNMDLSSLLNWIKYKNSAKIVITGKKLQGINNTRLEYSTNFFAVLHQIKKLDCVKSDIFQLSEVPIQEPDEARYYDEDEGERSGGASGVRTNLIVSQSTPFKLNDKVYGLVNIMQNQDNSEKNPMRTEEFQVTICSDILTAEDLRQMLQSWVEEYNEHLNSDKHLKYFVYTPSSDASEDYYDATSHYSEFRFESGKSFSNIFFPERDDIVKRLEFFAKNKGWYKSRGIPYTMGFLFYGEPGCGKTSTIKAIANHTQRHIVSVPLNKIKTGKELLNVFYNVKMNHKDIPLHQRLYVLEDIDCADLKNIVSDRDKRDRTNKQDNDGDNNSEHGSSNGNDKEDPMDILNLLKMSTVPFDKKANKLTLATLLEVLDGVMEMDGRMLVITTNYPEKLDKALIRPGRIDLKVKFDKCTRGNLVDMYQHYFDETSIPDGFDREELPERRWTPAEATQVFLNNMHNPANGLNTLLNSHPKSLHED